MGEKWIAKTLTSEAHPWSSIERDVAPADFPLQPVLPPLRSEQTSIRAVEVFATVHDVWAVAYGCATPD